MDLGGPSGSPVTVERPSGCLTVGAPAGRPPGSYAEYTDDGADEQRRRDQQSVDPEEAGGWELSDPAGGPGPRVLPDGDGELGQITQVQIPTPVRKSAQPRDSTMAAEYASAS